MSRVKTTLEIMRSAFKRKRNNAETLAAVMRAHPRSKLTLATVNWHRNQLRREDPTIPTEHSLR